MHDIRSDLGILNKVNDITKKNSSKNFGNASYVSHEYKKDFLYRISRGQPSKWLSNLKRKCKRLPLLTVKNKTKQNKKQQKQAKDSGGLMKTFSISLC